MIIVIPLHMVFIFFFRSILVIVRSCFSASPIVRLNRHNNDEKQGTYYRQDFDFHNNLQIYCLFLKNNVILQKLILSSNICVKEYKSLP